MEERRKEQQRGSVLVVGLMVLSIVTLLGTAAVLISNIETKIAHNTRKSEQAFYAAEAGIERMLCLKHPVKETVEKGDIISSESAGKPLNYHGEVDRDTLKYQVEVIDVISLLWGVEVVHVESIGYDSSKRYRRTLQCDIQIAPDTSWGTVYEGTYKYEYTGGTRPEKTAP
jgi:hypothetical protein